MKDLNILFAFLIVYTSAFAQQHKIAAVSDHYKTLQQFSSVSNSTRAWMDTVKYPPAEYGSSIVYLLVKPYYLSDSQVKSLSESVKFPANSSDQVREELDYML